MSQSTGILYPPFVFATMVPSIKCASLARLDYQRRADGKSCPPLTNDVASCQSYCLACSIICVLFTMDLTVIQPEVSSPSGTIILQPTQQDTALVLK